MFQALHLTTRQCLFPYTISQPLTCSLKARGSEVEWPESTLSLTKPLHMAGCSILERERMHPGEALLLKSPLDTLCSSLMNTLQPKNPLLLPTPSNPALRHSPMLATQHVFLHRGVNALSIIIKGFVESWGPGNVPECVKVSMRNALSCPQMCQN